MDLLESEASVFENTGNGPTAFGSKVKREIVRVHFHLRKQERRLYPDESEGTGPEAGRQGSLIFIPFPWWEGGNERG